MQFYILNSNTLTLFAKILEGNQFFCLYWELECLVANFLPQVNHFLMWVHPIEG